MITPFNPFSGYLADWIIDLIHRRAVVFGFQPGEWPDIEQDLVLQIVALEYDADRGHERTALSALIDYRLKMRLRSRRRRQRRQERYDELHRRTEATSDIEDPYEDVDRATDVQMALEGLGKTDRWVCQEMMEGRSHAAIARELGETRYFFDRRVDAIRQHFIAAGLNIWLRHRRGQRWGI